MNGGILKDENTGSQILDALPSPVFIMDKNLRVMDANSAAMQIADIHSDVLLKRLCGDILHCLYERNSDESCGSTEHCPECIIRKSVQQAVEGITVYQQSYTFMRKVGDENAEIQYMITASPFRYNNTTYALLILNDITELDELRSLIPICMHCRKIRTDEQYWQQFEDYIMKYSDLRFTHGVCPDCLESHYGNWKGK